VAVGRVDDFIDIKAAPDLKCSSFDFHFWADQNWGDHAALRGVECTN
jgi:hypothetical protein